MQNNFRKNITPKEGHEMLKKIPNAILIDVRTHAEVRELAIPKTLHIPLDELSLRLREIPIDATVIFHCQSGWRSAQTALFAEKAGYKNTHNVVGGIIEWASSGLPVTRGVGVVVSRGFARQGIIALVAIVSIIIFIGLVLFFMVAPKPEMQTGTPNLSAEIEKPATLVNLTSKELAVMLEKKDFFFANVHIPYEGEIKNTDAFIPYDEVADNLDKLPKDKGAKIVLYCQSDRMSKIAGNELLRLGYTDVSHLSLGMVAWERSGYEIIKK